MSKAYTPEKSRFKNTGTIPFNPDAIPEYGFLNITFRLSTRLFARAENLELSFTITALFATGGKFTGKHAFLIRSNIYLSPTVWQQTNFK